MARAMITARKSRGASRPQAASNRAGTVKQEVKEETETTETGSTRVSRSASSSQSVFVEIKVEEKVKTTRTRRNFPLKCIPTDRSDSICFSPSKREICR
jgi:hypothetical protein